MLTLHRVIQWSTLYVLRHFLKHHLVDLSNLELWRFINLFYTGAYLYLIKTLTELHTSSINSKQILIQNWRKTNDEITILSTHNARPCMNSSAIW